MGCPNAVINFNHSLSCLARHVSTLKRCRIPGGDLDLSRFFLSACEWHDSNPKFKIKHPKIIHAFMAITLKHP